MEWWQIFGIIFLWMAAMYVYASVQREGEKERQREELTVMTDPYEDGQWQHPGEMAAKGGNSSGGLRQRAGEDEEDESFVTRLPKVINERLNQKLTKSTLRDKVEIGKLQVEHITNANNYADQYFDLANKSKINKAKGLELDKKILENENALKDVQTIDSHRDLQNKDKKLDLDISIAEKEARFAAIKNPPQPPKEMSKKELREQERTENDEQIAKLEDALRQLKANDLLSEESRQTQNNQIQNKLFELYQRRIDLL